MLKVRLLHDRAITPTVAHPGEDLGYDLYSAEDGVLLAGKHISLRTGVSVEFRFDSDPDLRVGFLAKERSSMAKRGVVVLGGVIDAGYRGEIHLMLGSFANEDIHIKSGDKIANLIPLPVLAKRVEITAELALSARGESAFGSTDDTQ